MDVECGAGAAPREIPGDSPQCHSACADDVLCYGCHGYNYIAHDSIHSIFDWS